MAKQRQTRVRVLLLAAAVPFILPGCGVVAELPTTSMPDSFSKSSASEGLPMAVSAPAEATASKVVMPVYWLAQNESDIQLYREFLPSENTGDPIGEAVQAMTAQVPRDSDYFTPWQPASEVTASISSKNIITVDITSDAFKASLDAGMAHRAVQQLVYTATAAAANAGLTTAGYSTSVIVLVDGKAGYQAFGHELLEKPLERDKLLPAPIWIIDPQEGDGVETSVTVTGSAVVREEKLSWSVEPIVKGRPDTSAATTGRVALDAATGETALFEVSIKLEPGEYNLRVFHGDGANEDSKRITVY
ncbi:MULTISPECIES: GerMN domain-containing protein [Arthrobacter]|uniref:GerMN domain-containing protein n=1 Tax=Arthrobacter caoxuetaonis TaxID=2886935 RepID=A0A9X1MD84_9MICC|nr:MULTISPECIES: GerMN domain-containing protein [Arthrobacter]MCC3282769.1 GerMN domain-containing protein [Arthrobacter caoxuetaonis]MCC3297903.1 GerMN domain-containing protein [Arthrobacter caoxuetaonis]MCC9193557.1 GerMN domain-containing protein [Arthrobacter sp. zg-Y916]USQ55912.1 GerMN domain-containing protein [Arthrobacter caoxuetaonis]